MRYIQRDSMEQRKMLETVGVASLDALFSDIPREVLSRFEPIGLPGRSELEVFEHFSRLAEANGAATGVSLLGGGVYDHYVPRAVAHVLGRSEFYTAYTPYQPEISQGTLTAMFEFQTMVCELTGMEIANASMYDGATALAEAVLMANRIRGYGRVAVSQALGAPLRRVLDTYCWAAGIEVLDVPFGESGQTRTESLPADVSAFVIQSPNALGVLEPLNGVKDRLGQAFLVVSTYPLALGLLEPPGSFGADVVVGEGQSLGLPMGFGGPLLGLFATRKEYLRQIPGRVAGRTLDASGAVGYTMAAQTREQHIRRERATSNICTNSALCALAATVYLAILGSGGLRQVAQLNFERAHDLAETLARRGCTFPFDGPFFNEFVVRPKDGAGAAHARLTAAGFVVEASQALTAYGVNDALRLAITERRTDEELRRVADLLGGTS
ncbi:MAG: aminomethyl-transferring glycine dehydrogenase subunit GcvPA [Candidatus Bipolaricaulota bacterium]